MCIEIFQGDIFAIDADALVVPANVQPDLGWGSHISEKIQKLASPEVMSERKQFGNIPLGGACITSGTGTPFATLIHASVLNKYDFNPLFLLRLMQRTSDQTLKTAVSNARNIAESEQLQTIAISAIGAGIGGMNYAKCCHITFSELKDSHCQWIFAAFTPNHKKIADSILQSIHHA